jgi:hypothetical protein
MASIDQSPGALDMTSMIQGEALAFQTIHDGDITADTFYAAVVTDTGVTVVLGITSSYSGTTLKTTLTYTLTSVNAALIPLGQHYWYMLHTVGGVARTDLMGKWGCNGRGA